ncbi:MAG TPA: hypothetical protein VF179_17170 [Thermoanaerobaculia bacterium]|nr:hypothetical protein [Thermoanaerobaculia bacterium]
MRTHLALAFALFLICIGTGAALAQTPDGLPPALETICDMEQGAAYGLCNAYCEAMDCELANDGDPGTEPKASATACSKVRDKYQQTTGRDLPCEVTCPCNAPGFPIFPDFVSGQIPIGECFAGPLGAGGGIGVIAEPGFPNAVSLPSTDDEWICGTFPVIGLPITPAQGQFCAQLLEQAANSQGVSCLPE